MGDRSWLVRLVCIGPRAGEDRCRRAGSDARGRSRVIALGRSRGAGSAVPYPASLPDAVSRVLRGRGRTSGVPVSGSAMTWTFRPKTSSTISAVTTHRESTCPVVAGRGLHLGGPFRPEAACESGTAPWFADRSRSSGSRLGRPGRPRGCLVVAA